MKRNSFILALGAVIVTGCMSLSPESYTLLDSPFRENPVAEPAAAGPQSHYPPTGLEGVKPKRQSASPFSYEELAISTQDIFLGMSARAVRKSWGPPRIVEETGPRERAVERWFYKAWTPTPQGYREQRRIVYFENGQVIGWESY